MSKDYAEIMLQAMDAISSKRIEAVRFDTTDSATIVETVDSDLGKYVVSTGTTKYVAYSVNTKYRVGDRVYVTVPNGDYEQQKIIIGKQVTDSSKPFVYVAPFDTIVNISENLIPKTAKIQAGIRANCFYDYSEERIKSILKGEDQEYQSEGFLETKIWEREFDKENLVGYTRLGIQAQFMSWLYTWRTISGDYGLKLQLIYKVKNCESYLHNYEETLYKLQGIFDYENTDAGRTAQTNDWNWILNSSFVPIENDRKELNTINVNYLIGKTDDLLNSLQGVRTLYFDCSNFYGDPYNFNTWFQQEAVFDISSLGEEAQIVKMELYFYQTPGTFFRQNEQPVPYRPENSPFGDEETGFLEPNLYVKDPYICVGFGVGEFEEDDLSLYTIDSLTYSYVIPDNYTEEDWLRKTLQLRWIHEYEDGTISEVKKSGNSELPQLNYEIRWYRYELGAPAPDPYAGVYWRRIERNDPRSFSYEISGNNRLKKERPEEKFKVIILLYKLNDEEQEYYTNIYRSNILTFTNEDEVISQKILDQITGFFLDTNDGSDGNYFIYGQNGHIKEQPDSKQIRQVQCFFKPNNKVTAEILTDATKLIWRFPAKNSMIKLADIAFGGDIIKDSDWIGGTNNRTISTDPNKGAAVASFDEIDTWEIAPSFVINQYGDNSQKYELGTQVNTNNYGQQNSGVVYHVSWSKVWYDLDTDEYVIGYKGDPSYNYFINPVICYTLNSDYIVSNTSNTISCTIEKDGITYTAYKTMRFGPAGTNGSAYTLIVEFDDTDNSSFVLTEGTSEEIGVTAYLLDENGRKVSDYEGTYEWEWLLPTSGSKVNISSGFAENDTLHDHITLAHNSVNLHPIAPANEGESWTDPQLYYLQCKLINFGSYPLVRIIPIAVRKNRSYVMRTGPTQVTYKSTGYPWYYTGPYTLSQRIDGEDGWDEITNGNWQICNPYGVLNNFLGNINVPENTLQPCGIYVKDAGQYGVQFLDENNEVLWTQPIYCCINEYPSSTLNRWDGKGIEIDEANGTIVAPAIAAGKKNYDNTFSGVMMGDWNRKTDTASELAEQTGIYGLNHGSVSYAFMEDGTAFIGKSGMGRILFDGSESTIKSEAYQQGDGGMKIDLDDGIIDIQGTIKTARNPVFHSNNNDGTGYYKSDNTYTRSGSEITISANGPTYLSIKTEDPNIDETVSTLGTEIMHVGSDNYFLQSDDFLAPTENQAARGTKIDLKTGNVILANSVTWSDSGDNKPYQVLYCRGIRHDAYVIADDINNSNFDGQKSSLYIKGSQSLSDLAAQLQISVPYLMNLINSGAIDPNDYYLQVQNNATFDPYMDYYRQGVGANRYYYTAPLIRPTHNQAGKQDLPSNPPDPASWHSNFTTYTSNNDSIDPYGSDNYYSVSYDTGQTWSKPQAINGHFDSSNLLASLLNNKSIDGIYNNGTDIGIRAAAIRTGLLYSREGNLATTDNTFDLIRQKVHFTLDLDTGKIDLHNNQGDYLRIGTGNTDGISLGNGAFIVDSSGNLTLQDNSNSNSIFKISPKGNISATINNNSLTNLVIQSGTIFGVTKDGKLYSSSGQIGGWTITSDTIESYSGSSLTNINPAWLGNKWAEVSNLDNGYFLRSSIYKDGYWQYPFTVDDEGKLTATNADIKGTIRVEELYIDNQKVVKTPLTIPVRFEVEPITGPKYLGSTKSTYYKYYDSDTVYSTNPGDKTVPWSMSCSVGQVDEFANRVVVTFPASYYTAAVGDTGYTWGQMWNLYGSIITYFTVNYNHLIKPTAYDYYTANIDPEGTLGYTPKITKVIDVNGWTINGVSG